MSSKIQKLFSSSKAVLVHLPKGVLRYWGIVISDNAIHPTKRADGRIIIVHPLNNLVFGEGF